jgi:general secretion pathway protein C
MDFSISTKHYLWLGNVLVLGVVVWSTVSLGLDMVGQRLKSELREQGQVVAASSDGPHLKTLPQYETIVQHNMFRGKQEAAPAPSEADVTTPQSVPGRMVTDDFRLLGTIVDAESRQGWVVLEDVRSREQNLFKAGDRIGTTEIIEVTNAYVLLKQNGMDVRLDIFDIYGNSADAGRPAPRPAAPAQRVIQPDEASTAAQGAGGSGEPIAREVGENAYVVEREILGQHMGDLSFFMSHVRIQPYFQDGQPHGFKVAAVRSGSPVHELGFRRGDVILEVNDVSVGKPEDLINLYRQMQQLETITVKLERDGALQTLTYSLR